MEKTLKNFLFEDFKARNFSLKNRIVLAPMTRVSSTDDGVPTERMLKYYKKFANGDFSLIITEGIYTDESFSQGYLNQPGLTNEKHAEGWQKIIDAIHEEGSKVFAQIMHAGALSQGNYYSKKTIAPSSVKPKGEQLAFYVGKGEYPKPAELTYAEMEQVIAGFCATASRAKEIGFDGIELHGANGYILDQFLTDYTNKRQDQYGGSTENRVRFLVEVIKATRDAVGDEFPLGIRISQAKVNDNDHKWKNGKEDAKVIFEKLRQAGIDFIHITEPKAYEPAFSDSEETLVSLAKKFSKVPIIANGDLQNPKVAEEILVNDQADLISLGKGALANQDWPEKVKSGGKIKKFDAKEILLPIAKIKDIEI